MATVSVLIVTYNIQETIVECLESLNYQKFRDMEAILIDNNSKDNTKALVESFKSKASYPLKTIYLDTNTGFCLGNNTALKHAGGKYIALLNPDARADSRWLEELVAAMDSNRAVGVCASKVLTWDSGAIDSAGDMMLSTFRCFKREAENPDRYHQPELVFGACAAGALYRKEMIEQIGFFDEDFFLQCEDTDLNFRSQLAGWKVAYVPTAVIYHKVSNSIGKASDVGVYYSQRNMEFVRIKNVPASILIMYTPHIALGFIIDFVYFGLVLSKWKLFIKAKIDALKMFSTMLRKRKQITKEIKKVDNAYIRSLINPLFNDRHFIKLKLKRIVTRKTI